MYKMNLESLPIFYWRIANYVPQNMPLWHEDYFELAEIEKKQKQEKACFFHLFAYKQDINLPRSCSYLLCRDPGQSLETTLDPVTWKIYITNPTT